MDREPDLAQVLGSFVERSGYSMGQLSRLARIPKRTIANWLGGRVERPRHVDDLLKLARVLHLRNGETNELLRAAKHPPLSRLQATLQDEVPAELLMEVVAPESEPAPFQAIPDLPYFVGREQEVQALHDVLVNGGRALICSLQGMGGVGKTALAAHLAYRCRPYFPDGVLWARVDRAEPMSILNVFASVYGRDVSRYTDLESRSQIVREILADKKALIVLDNVRRSEEVEPLLPPSVGCCAVIITTRQQNLAVTSGTYRFTVGPFDRARGEALALFTRILGEERVQQQRKTLMQIADLLGHLPLAVAIAASRLAYEPGWSAPAFLEHLQRESARLDLLRYEDQSVRLTAHVSYEMLPAEQQTFFAALGVFNPEHLNVEALASITGRTQEAAEEALRHLYSLSLVQPAQGRRYRLHPLLHDLARERLGLSENRQAFLCGFVHYYADYAKRNRRNPLALERDLDNLLTAVEVAYVEEMKNEVTHIVADLQSFLETKGFYELAAQHLQQARVVARSLGDSTSLAQVLLYWTRLARKRGRFGEAKATAAEGLTHAQQSGDSYLISALSGELGAALSCLGESAEAATHYQLGLALARELDEPELMSTHLLYMGIDEREPQIAEKYYEEGLALARRIGDTTKEGKFLNNLGAVASDQGKIKKAEAYFRETFTLAHKLGYQELTAVALINLGEGAKLREAYSEAQTHLEEALAIARQLGHKQWTRHALEQLGELASLQEQHEAEVAYYRQALAVARKSEDDFATSSLLLILAQTLRKCDAKGETETYFRESLPLLKQGRRCQERPRLLIEWGDLLLQEDNVPAATVAYTEALALAQKVEAREVMEEARRHLVAIGQIT